LNTVVLEQTEMGDMPLDVYQKLSNDRILFVTGEIDEKNATDICATLLLKSHENDGKITLFINSHGGSIRDAFMIYDMMMMIDVPVETVCVGEALDEAALILTAGEPGMRLATKNSILAVSQLEHKYWAMHANMVDAKKYLQMAEEDNKRYLSVIAETCDKSYKEVEADFDRRVFMNSNRALKYGLIDKVVRFSK